MTICFVQITTLFLFLQRMNISAFSVITLLCPFIVYVDVNNIERIFMMCLLLLWKNVAICINVTFDIFGGYLMPKPVFLYFLVTTFAQNLYKVGQTNLACILTILQLTI